MSRIIDMYSSGELAPFIIKGIIKETIPLYCEIYKAFQMERNHGLSYYQSLEVTAEGMNVSMRTVKRAISMVTK